MWSSVQLECRQMMDRQKSSVQARLTGGALRLWSAWLVWLVVVFTVMMTGANSAHASGIALNRFGGIFGHANTTGGLSLFWNPSRISIRPGGYFTVDATMVSRNASYVRRIYEDERERTDRVGNPFYNDPGVLESNTGLATSSTLAVLPMLAGGYTFELPRLNVGFGAVLHPAYGGTAAWDKNLAAPSEYPGAVDGSQRWHGLASTFLILHGTLAGAITLPDAGLSFGAALSFARGEISTVRARNVNRGEQLVDANGYIQEGRIFFEGNDSEVSLSVSASLDRGPVTFSTQYRSGYNLTVRGLLRQAYATQPLTRIGAFLDFPTPHVFTSALSLRGGRFTGTVATDYSVWSRMRSNIIFVDIDPPDQLLEIPRNLQNTLSIRGLAEYEFIDGWTAGASLGWDPSAVPANSIDAALSDANKWQVGAGIRTVFGERWGTMLSYTQDFYETVESVQSVHEPTANGTYKDARRWLNLSVEVRL
jgi:long-chain fatty acid transport protein